MSAPCAFAANRARSDETIGCELIARDQDRHHVKGWHPTAVFGVLAVAGAVAALRRLDADTCRHALGIAASMASGLIANFGSMTKPFHAGRAAADGIDAVDLAQAGMRLRPMRSSITQAFCRQSHQADAWIANRVQRPWARRYALRRWG